VYQPIDIAHACVDQDDLLNIFFLQL